MTSSSEPGDGALIAPSGLLVRPTQQASESEGGFLLRLGHLNGIRPLWSNASQGISIRSPGLGIARWCPRCLSAPAPYWRKDWTDGVAICREHCCWLCDRCDECGSPAAWRHLRLRQCRCGVDLAQQPAEPWSDALQALLHAPEQIGDQSIDPAGAEQWLALAEVVGALDRYGLRGKPLKRASARAVSHQHAVVERGASIVVEAADELGPLLERLRVPSSPGQGAQLVGEAWPGLLRLLRRQLRGAVLAWITSQIEHRVACAALEGVAIQRARQSGDTPTGVRGLAKAAGVRVERVPALLSDCGVSVPMRRSKSGRQMAVVTDAVVTRVREHLEDLLSARVAQGRFGISAVRLQNLAEKGLVRRVGDRYSASSIQLLLKQIADAAKYGALGDVNEGRRWCSLHRALRLHVGHRQTVALFMALQAGSLEIRRVGRQIAHVHDLLLLESEVKAWSRAGAAPCEELTIPQAAALLGLKQEVTYHLVRVGLLATSRGFAGRRMSRVISRQEVERFRREVLPLSEAARAHGVDHRSAKCWALERRFTFVSGPGIDGGRQFFVRATCS